MSEVLLSAALLGLSAGFSPGPLMTLVLTQTLRHGAREGIRTALAPLITDTPVILLSLIFSSRLAEFHRALAVVSAAGGLFVLYLAWESLRPPPVFTGERPMNPRSWRKGIITNLLSPNPWLFWFTAGAAMLSKAISTGWQATVLFFVIFYALLCGGKAGIAGVAARSRSFLSGRAYHWVLRSLALLMALFACKLFHDGWRLWQRA